MSNIFNLDAPIWVFMSEVADIIILSLLWWVCCLGIITVGASTTAMYYVLGKKMRKETVYVCKDFFKSFRQNFRQSVPLSFITIIGTVSFVLYVSFILQSILTPENNGALKYLIPLTIFVAFEFFNLNAYMWGLLSRFDMPSRALIKSAFVMLHKHLITTIGNLLVIVMVVFFISKCSVAGIIAPGLIFGGQSFLLQKIFTRYIEAAEEAQREDKDSEGEEVIEEVVIEEQ